MNEEQMENAARTMAECLHWSWARMSEQGKQSMRAHVKAAIDASGAAASDETSR